MTAIAVAGNRSGLLAPLVPSRGIGPDASTVAERIERVCEHLWEPLTLRHVAESAWTELADVAQQATQPNWDGYGARAIDARAYFQAGRFLSALPTTTPLPDLSVDPDGEVSVSWNLDADWVFSVSVGPTGRLSYAGLFGTSKAYGTEWFVDEIPKAVLDGLTRLFKPKGRRVA